MSEATADPIKSPFRVHFHDGKTFDFHAVHPLVAERKARGGEWTASSRRSNASGRKTMASAALHELPTIELTWKALVTEDDEPFAAFVPGHRNPFMLAGDAEEAIVKAFHDLSPVYAEDVREILDEAGGAAISQFWLRPVDGMTADDPEAFFLIASADQRRAFPVTGVRFQ